MEKPVSKSSITPGLEESIHPGLGNGALWEQEMHAYLLRSVDPAKSLESLLNDPALSRESQERWANDLLERQAHETVPLPAGLQQVGDAGAASVPEAPPVPDMEEKTESPPPGKKQPAKAGKLVRKIAEKAAREEKEKQQPMTEPDASGTETGLTSFTRWLKGLGGSEYIHPYEDDFAFQQAEGPVREGISETFADLLAAQGYKDQAIDMYQRLMERFPEKSRLFAAKIEALR